MKFYTSLFILICLPIIFSEELGGLKAAITDDFINSVLVAFEDDIKDVLNGVRIDDREYLSNMIFYVPNFSLDKIDLSFGNDGLINIKISNLSPYLTGTVTYSVIFTTVSNNFKVTLNNFYLNARIRIKSRQIASDQYAPDAEFVGDPELDFDINFEIDGILGYIVEKILNFAGDFGKGIIMPLIRDKFTELLNDIFSDLPTEAQIGDFWVDYTLASPIRLNNKYLEINSYALIYSKDFPETKNRTRYSLSSLPDITTNNQLQLLVSEYTINSAAFTFLTAYKINNILKYTISTSFVNVMLPDISKKYGVKNADISLLPKPESKVTITEEYMNIELPGTFYVTVEDVENPVFVCELDLAFKAQANIEYGPKITAKINELNATIKEILVNEATTATEEKIQSGLDLIKNALVPVANEYIKKYASLPFPSIMGLDFTEAQAQHKNGYLLLNLNIK